MAAERFRLSRQALADLEQIADYLGQLSPSAAARVLDKLLETFDTIGNHPEAGTLRDDLHDGIRMFVPATPADKYIIFFYALPNGVEISDVIHSARDWIGIFARSER